MKVVAVIEARCGSSRLPNKILMDLAGKPSLERMIERVRQAKALDDLVVATTTNGKDDAVEELCRRIGVNCFRGSENDVLDRVVRAVQSVQGDIIVEVTGDCPLMDPHLIDHMVREFRREPTVDYCANIKPYSWPEGFDVQVFPWKDLKLVNESVADPSVHEHVSLYFYQTPGRYRTRFVTWDRKDKWHPDWHLSLDEQSDYELIKTVFQALLPKSPLFSVDEVVDFLEKSPWVLKNKRLEA